MHGTLFPLVAGHHGESRGGDTAHTESYQLKKAGPEASEVFMPSLYACP